MYCIPNSKVTDTAIINTANQNDPPARFIVKVVSTSPMRIKLQANNANYVTYCNNWQVLANVL